MKTFKPMKRFWKLIFVVSNVCYKVWETLFGWHVACKNIRFSSLFVAEDVSRETSTATESVENGCFRRLVDMKLWDFVIHKQFSKFHS